MSNKQIQTLEIRIDGELQTPPINEQALAMGTLAVKDVQRVTSVFMHKLGNVASEVFTPVILDIHDAQHGSHLREEYFARKHELATAAMREEVGL